MTLVGCKRRKLSSLVSKAESKAGKLIATVKAGRLVRQTRKTGQVSSNMPVVTAERKRKRKTAIKP